MFTPDSKFTTNFDTTCSQSLRPSLQYPHVVTTKAMHWKWPSQRTNLSNLKNLQKIQRVDHGNLSRRDNRDTRHGEDIQIRGPRTSSRSHKRIKIRAATGEFNKRRAISLSSRTLLFREQFCNAYLAKSLVNY